MNAGERMSVAAELRYYAAAIADMVAECEALVSGIEEAEDGRRECLARIRSALAVPMQDMIAGIEATAGQYE